MPIDRFRDMTTIGFSTPVLANSVIQAMIRALAGAAAPRGARILAADAELNVEKQANDIARLVEAGSDALLVYPAGDPHALQDALSAAAEAGVLLFSHDELGHTSVVTQLVTPVEVMGALAADLLAELLAGDGTVAIIAGVPAPSLVERIKGFRRRIATEHPGLRIIETISNPIDIAAGAEAAMAQLLADGANPNGVFGYNDSSAIGAARAAAAAGLSPAIVGNNAEPHGVQAVAEGVIAATVDRHPIELALKGAAVILDTIEGRIQVSEAPERIAVEPTTVTKGNVDSFIPWESRCHAPPAGSWEVL
jgi:ribose transport system substrate-binding protein